VKQWHIKVVGRQRKEIDKHLIVQAVLALGRQLKQQQASRDNQSTAEGRQ